MIKRYQVLNIWTDGADMAGALARVEEFVESGDRVHTIFATNPEKNFSASRDPFLHKVLENADLLVPDGIGIVAAVRLLFGVRLKRVPGCELMQNICGLAAQKGYGIFLYGAREEVSSRAAANLRTSFPNIRIAGRANGYIPEDKMNSLVEQINGSRARILFVALGSPKQERWIAKYAPQLKHVRVCQGIGGTLDVIAGTVDHAPAFFCSTGLEWLYRLLREPSRLKRQIVLPVFAFQVVLTRLGMMTRKVSSKQQEAHSA